MMCSLAACVISSVIPWAVSWSRTRSSIRSTIWAISSTVRLRNTTVASIRLRNSGRKFCLSSAWTFSFIRSYEAGARVSVGVALDPEAEAELVWSCFAAPRFEVMMMIVLRKSTRRPLASVRCPSSRIWRRMLNTSGVRLLDLVEQDHARSSCGGRPRSAGRPRRTRRSLAGAPTRRLTLWRSMNSLMSILMSASSEPNMNSASALASSVFPTPVGPRKMNEPIGRLGSLRPARARRTARETVSIASSWPMTRPWRTSSILSRRSDSSCAMRVTGMPVHIATTWAISSSSTLGGSPDAAACHSARRLSTLSRDGRLRLAQRRRLLVLLGVDRGVLLLGDPVQLLLRGAQGGRGGGVAEADAAGGLVDEVDRLVGEVAVRDVADREVGGGLDRLVRDRDLVVLLVALADAHEDLDRLLERGLLDHDRLEAPLEGRVPLDVLAVLVERGRADALELAARERRLEDVRGVDRALGRARADERVELVDEQDRVVGVAQLLDDLLEPLLELAAVLGAGDERADVERQDALVEQDVRDVARRRSGGPGPRRWPSCRRRAPR